MKRSLFFFVLQHEKSMKKEKIDRQTMNKYGLSLLHSYVYAFVLKCYGKVMAYNLSIFMYSIYGWA